ncbi:MAG: hypothetical protein KF768_09150 [Phycisphaeraceae bacterium]|nr:hypothetical protein [Phycisphaeraceae bacterium]
MPPLATTPPSTRRQPLRTPFLLYALLAATLSACVNVTAVRDFALHAAAVTQDATVSRLGPESVERSLALAHASPSADALRETLEAARRDSARAQAIQRIVTEYFLSVARLADDQRIEFDSELLAFTDAAAGVGVLRNQRDAAATRSILNLIARAATDAHRRARLAEVIRTADEPLAHLLDALTELAERGTLSALDDESALAELAFGTTEREARDSLEPARANHTASTLRTLRREHARTQEARSAFLRAHVAALREIREAHALLARDAATTGPRELAAFLRPHLERLETLLTRMRAAPALAM